MKFVLRNEFYTKRRQVAGKETSNLASVKALELSGQNKVYISEFLTPFRKKLFGTVNRTKKKLGWRLIWSNNEQFISSSRIVHLRAKAKFKKTVFAQILNSYQNAP